MLTEVKKRALPLLENIKHKKSKKNFEIFELEIGEKEIIVFKVPKQLFKSDNLLIEDNILMKYFDAYIIKFTKNKDYVKKR